MVDQALAVREADRMHEDHDIQLLGLGEEFFQAQFLIGEIHAAHARIDLYPAQSQELHCMGQFLQGQRRILQRHRAKRDEAVGVLRHDLREPLVHRARELGA